MQSHFGQERIDTHETTVGRADGAKTAHERTLTRVTCAYPSSGSHLREVSRLRLSSLLAQSNNGVLLVLLTGLFNFLVYTRPVYLQWRNTAPRNSRLWALSHATSMESPPHGIIAGDRSIDTTYLLGASKGISGTRQVHTPTLSLEATIVLGWESDCFVTSPNM
jgi:hypothetical protein